MLNLKHVTCMSLFLIYWIENYQIGFYQTIHDYQFSPFEGHHANKFFYNIVKVTVSHVPFIIQSFLNHTDGWSTLFLTSMKSSFYTGIHITRIFSNFATDSFHHIHLRSEKLGLFFKPEVIQTYLRKWKNLVCTSFVIICGYLVIRGKSEET